MGDAKRCPADALTQILLSLLAFSFVIFSFMTTLSVTKKWKSYFTVQKTLNGREFEKDEIVSVLLHKTEHDDL